METKHPGQNRFLVLVGYTLILMAKKKRRENILTLYRPIE